MDSTDSSDSYWNDWNDSDYDIYTSSDEESGNLFFIEIGLVFSGSRSVQGSPSCPVLSSGSFMWKSSFPDKSMFISKQKLINTKQK